MQGGTALLYRIVLLIGLTCCFGAAYADPEDPAVGGAWDAPVPWPFVPVAAANLPDGRILGWAGSERKREANIGEGPERTYTGVWDPRTGRFLQVLHPTHNMFCGAEVLLEDGSVMVNGGLNAGMSRGASTFDYRTNQWIEREDMNRGRYYPTTVALPDGTVFTALGEGGGNTGERWDGRGWDLLSGVDLDIPILNFERYVEREWFPQLQVAPDGRIFHSGPTPRMHMIDTTGVGSITRVGPAITGWYPKDGVSVMYDKGKILTAGGWVDGNDNSASRRAMVIDINGAVPTITLTGDMNFPRRFVNSVTLPNGEVAVIGGSRQRLPWVALNDRDGVLPMEIWNPTTQTFRVGAAMAVPRIYHSVALLMVDGRVWSGGGGLCSCSRDHPDAQIWSPPYLFNANGTQAVRPELFSAPGAAPVGSRIPVRGTAGLARFSMVKMSAVTHSINTDMRFLSASFRETSAGTYIVDLESNRNVLTPGYWMLFGLNARGVPSVAKVIQVTSQALSSGEPVLSDIDGFSHPTNAPIDITLVAMEPDGDPLTFSATGLPPGVVLGAQTGRFTGAPTAPGTYAVTVTVADRHGNDSTTFDWTVLNDQLSYEYYPGRYLVVPEWDQMVPLKTGVVSNFTLDPRTREEAYGFRYRGFIHIETPGAYRFFTESDDGSQLFIDGALLVDNNGVHVLQERFGDISLTAGPHMIEVGYFARLGAGQLTVSYRGPGIAKQPIPDDVLAPQGVNRAPVLTNPGSQTTSVGQPITLGIAANDPDRDTLTFSATNLPAGLSIHPSTGVISGTHTLAMVRTVQVTASDGPLNAAVTFAWTVTANAAPRLTPIADQAGSIGDVVSFPVGASDANGDVLTFTATLPPGLLINRRTGLITGTLGAVGNHAVTVTVRDAGPAVSTTFRWNVTAPVVPIVIQPIAAPPRQANVPVAFNVSATGTPPLRYRWSYGDGSPVGAFTTSPSRSYVYAAPGRYIVTVTVRDGQAVERSVTFTQAIYRAPTAAAPAQDSTIIVENVTGAERVWNVNPDAGTVAVINAATLTKIREIAVGTKPSSLALGGDGWVWVTNKGSDTLSRINPNGFGVAPPINLPRGGQPHGLVIDPVSGDALVVLEGLGRLLRIDGASHAIIGEADVGANARHLSVSSDGGRIYVARFITRALVGENTRVPSRLRSGQPAGGEVLVLDGTNLSTIATVVLRHSDAVTSEHSGPGLPNYLRSPTISPDGLSAWVPSKQDNILRGTLRNGQDLNHEHTVRAVTSRVDLPTLTANPVGDRIDLDSASVASAVAFDRTGSYLFVALEGNRTVAAIDAYRKEELFRFDAGRAPEGLVMDTAGRRLFVHNFMDRTVTVHDLSALIDGGANVETRLASIPTVAAERLSAQVLLGKQHFYDAFDERLALESYMSCASCHNEGGQDGRTWDFTGVGEGLRNTITLDGQGGMANGPLHWSGNFDELQDFEGQIRDFAEGQGLMSDASFHVGTRELPLGDRKAGQSADLDALAAYLSSLNTVAKSPYRAANGALTASAEAGAAVFVAKGCVSCHSGDGFTDSAIDVRHDIGTTLQPTSGSRLGAALDGFDTPTLRGLWRTAPYLHDGSAATLGDAIDAHDDATLSATQRSDLVDYLLSIDADEPGIAAPTAPMLEALLVSGVGSSNWTTVRLSARYRSLVATCSIHQANNVIPQVVRMRNVAADRFEIRLQNTADSALVGEKVYCLAAEEGHWKLANGRRFEARKYQSTRVDRVGKWFGEWRDSARFTNPVVLGQVMSYNDARWSVFWSHGRRADVPVTFGHLYTGHMIGEDPEITRASETIGYMIFESAVGTVDGVRYEAWVGEQTVRGWDNDAAGSFYYFNQNYPGPRLAIVGQAGMANVEGSFVSIRGAAGLTANAVSLVADEDQHTGPERRHGGVRASYFVIDQPALLELTPLQ